MNVYELLFVLSVIFLYEAPAVYYIGFGTTLVKLTLLHGLDLTLELFPLGLYLVLILVVESFVVSVFLLRVALAGNLCLV